MNIEELLVCPDRRSLAVVPQLDALSEEGAMLEAALVDVKFDAMTSTAWLLFDCREAVNLWIGNTAIVVVRGVTGLHWVAVSHTGHVWRSVARWEPASAPRRFSCVMEMDPPCELRVTGVAAEFYVGDISGGNEPPDSVDNTDEVVRAGVPSWASEFDVVSASFADPISPFDRTLVEGKMMDLISGRQTRQEVARWATELYLDDDRTERVAPVIISALSRLTAANIRSGEQSYLYGDVDFEHWLQDLRSDVK